MRLPVRLLVPLAVVAVGAAVLPATADSGLPRLPEQAAERAKKQVGKGSTAPAAPPMDYRALEPQLSQPDYPQTVREVVRIPAFDGEELYVEIVRPDPEVYPETADRRLPVILEASPYHGTVADRDGTRMFPDPVDAEGSMLGLTGYFAPRGYAVAMMDLRGTGRSQGCLDQLGPNDQKDLTTVVESLADAPWSNGRVGMVGHSYVGSTPSVAAAQKPRGLVTIVPSAGLASMYDHQFQLGVPYNLQYIGPQVAYEGLALSRDLPGEAPAVPVIGGPNGDNFDENGPNPQTGCGLPNSALFAGTGQVTGQYEQWHAERDSGAGAAAADIPIFMIHGANDNAARIPAAEWFFGNRFGKPGDKVWLGQWDHGSTNGRCGGTDGTRVLHPTCRFAQMQFALQAWFDKQLKQMDVPTGPAVEVFLNGESAPPLTQVVDPETLGAKVWTSDAWRAPTTTLGLYPDVTTGALGLTPPTEEGSASFRTGAQAVLTEVGAEKLSFTSEPFGADTTFVGLPTMQLRASVTSQVTHLVASLFREDSAGSRQLMNTCAIQPGLRNGKETVTPIVPGEAMDLSLQCFTAAQWVPAGQKLVLEIAGRGAHAASFGSDPNVTVFTGPDATAYTLPTVGGPLFDDVPLRAASADGGNEVPAPTGSAQAGESGSVTTVVGLVGERVEGVSAAGYEFTAQEGFDNATVRVVATPDTPADLDLYLQRKQADGTWSDDLATGETGSTSEELLAAGRLEPGDYRVLVVNWAGALTTAAVEVAFANTAGVAGGTPEQSVDAAAGGFLPLP